MPPKKSAAAQAFGRALREMRRERGYAQEVFAAQAGMDRSYFGAIERGEFNLSLDTQSSSSPPRSAYARASCFAGRDSERTECQPHG